VIDGDEVTKALGQFVGDDGQFRCGQWVAPSVTTTLPTGA
jgi:hypothetical protein